MIGLSEPWPQSAALLVDNVKEAVTHLGSSEVIDSEEQNHDCPSSQPYPKTIRRP